MTFKKAVEGAPVPVSGAYRVGIQALKKRHRAHVTCEDSHRLTGSIDLDKALAQEPDHADAPRWDYGVGYKPRNGSEWAVWVEVHSATTREVSTVLRKLQRLRDWLNADAVQLKRMTDAAAMDYRYVWIASKGVKIPGNSPQAPKLNMSGLGKVIRHLSLP